MQDDRPIRFRRTYLAAAAAAWLLALAGVPGAQEAAPGIGPEPAPEVQPEIPELPDASGTPDLAAPGAKAPGTPEEKTQLLAALYAQLAKAGSLQEAAPVAEAIERLWLHSGSDTVTLLMERSLKAAAGKNTELALALLDAVVTLAPDYAEGWNRRAYVFYLRNDYQRALGDLRRVLALEPNHYKALDGLGQILREIGEKKAALKVFQELQRINPQWPNVRQTVDELTREVEGQGI